jgi:hypothetical protein
MPIRSIASRLATVMRSNTMTLIGTHQPSNGKALRRVRAPCSEGLALLGDGPVDGPLSLASDVENASAAAGAFSAVPPKFMEACKHLRVAVVIGTHEVTQRTSTKNV